MNVSYWMKTLYIGGYNPIEYTHLIVWLLRKPPLSIYSALSMVKLKNKSKYMCHTIEMGHSLK